MKRFEFEFNSRHKQLLILPVLGLDWSYGGLFTILISWLFWDFEIEYRSKKYRKKWEPLRLRGKGSNPQK